MFKDKKITWHRPELSLRLEGEMASLPLDTGERRCVFPLFLRVADRSWALGVPLDQIRSSEVDMYVFAYEKDGSAKLLSPAPEEGFAEMVAEVTDVPPEEA